MAVEDRFDTAREELARNAIAVLRQQLLDAQRALAWLLWQQPYREAVITDATMRDMPADVTLVSECAAGSEGLRLWVQKGSPTSDRTSD